MGLFRKIFGGQGSGQATDLATACPAAGWEPEGTGSAQYAIGYAAGYEIGQEMGLNSAVLYVDAAMADDTGNGRTWATAKKYLQSALLSASYGQEIWIKSGTYYPDEGLAQTDGDAASVFSLRDNVAIFGGFFGDETERSQRDWQANPTILSGDINQDGTNKSYRVVLSLYNNASAILDGVIITDGDARGYSATNRGGGIYAFNSGATFANLSIVGNVASYSGGGVYNESSASTFTNILISGNRGGIYGGGVYNKSSASTFTNILISGNKSVTQGGGCYLTGTPATFINTTIAGNTSPNGGGFRTQVSNAIFINCVVSQNNTNISAFSSTVVYKNTLIGATLYDGAGAALPDVIDPMFVAPATPVLSTGGDYRLQLASPLVDAGDTAENTTTTDLDGNPRVSGLAIDIGAYEVQQ